MIARYRSYLQHKEFLVSSLFSIVLLILSLIINFYAGTYATDAASNPVTDIILSNVPLWNIDAVFVYGTLLFWLFVTLVCITKPQTIPFLLKSISLFVLIRSVFVSLTHLGPFPTHIAIQSNILNKFVFGGDLFFSGHTGLPFLLALLFWDSYYLRLLFLVSSIIFGVLVLLGHLHYSIDVLAAFFITFAIYHLAQFLFKRDERIFKEGIKNLL